MSRRLRRVGGLGAVAAGVVGTVALGGGLAGAQVPDMEISPGSGPAGTVIAVTGTGCTGAQEGETATVDLGLGNGRTHDTETVTAAVDGSWTATLVVLLDAEAGEQLVVSAICNSGSATYEDEPFTVEGTPPTTEPPTTTTSTTSTTTIPSTPGPGRGGPSVGAPAAPGPQSGLSVSLMPPATPVVAEPNHTG
jgi:hypothetical protein